MPKYSKELNQELEIIVAEILAAAEDGLTLQEIGIQIGKNGLTTQKIARVVAKVNEFSQVIKHKGKDGLTRYKSYYKHEADGYDMSVYQGPKGKIKFIAKSTYGNPGEEGWVSSVYARYCD